MNEEHRRKLNNLSLELVTKAALAIDDLGLKPTIIIPFCIMMLENTIKILNQSKEHNLEFAKNYPENIVDLAISQCLSMFSQTFGVECVLTSVNSSMHRIDKKMDKKEIEKEVDEFLKNLPKRGEHDNTKRNNTGTDGSKEGDKNS